ncbi:alpha/beta fold hydrolase [Phycicoccus mangrovi]|uniref:alpha/beta fold hydrolase n=1 Tax=Phycicoccus mangrovi TaxID=2840470 RepID=UPI0027E3A386|nr:alpha/beta fold hydrolase [Phycicoccus mangrovi]
MVAREQRIGRAPMADGTRVTHAVTGTGPALVVSPGWLSHLELDWSIPAQRLFYDALSSGRTLVRYDRPGCGLSDPYTGPRSLEHELATLSTVVDALHLDRFDLFGWSLGAPVAARWAADHPDTVSRLVLYGGWARGSEIGDEVSRTHVRGLLAGHWGLGSDVLTELFAPEADPGTRRVLARYQRAASSAETAVGLLDLAYGLDVTQALARICAPTLVLHRDQDRAAPPAQGRLLADRIPGARLVELSGRSHFPTMGDSRAVIDQVRRFLGLRRLQEAAPVGLTPRQSEVAALVAQGLTNREVAQRLHLSERSVESHVERIRLRLGFRSRTQLAAWYVAQQRS